MTRSSVETRSAINEIAMENESIDLRQLKLTCMIAFILLDIFDQNDEIKQLLMLLNNIQLD